MRILGCNGRTARLRLNRVGPLYASDDGYVASEALMASMVLGAALAFGLTAFVKARQMTDASLELRRATALAQTAMAVHLDETNASFGQTPTLSWRMALEDTGQTGRISICRRAIHMESRSASARKYAAAGLETCAPKAEA